MGLKTYIIKRVIYMLFLIWFVLTLNFIIFEVMPADPTQFFTGRLQGRTITEAKLQELLQTWGLLDPIEVRYSKYVTNMLTFNFGHSISTGKPVAELISVALPNTIMLMGVSTVVSIIIGVLTGAVAAYKRGGKLDTTLVLASLTTYALPTFWMGMLALIIFGRNLGPLGFFPVGGTLSNFPNGLPPPLLQTSAIQVGNLFTIPGISIPSLVEIYDRAWHLFLPAAVLTVFQYGGYLLLTRATMVESLSEDYIVTARAKGVKERTVILRHALKNASLPIITSVALAFGFMLSGAIITETVFSWPGLGRLTIVAINNVDYPILHVLFYVIALCVILANFVADLLYGVVDPRIKYG